MLHIVYNNSMCQRNMSVNNNNSTAYSSIRTPVYLIYRPCYVFHNSVRVCMFSRLTLV